MSQRPQRGQRRGNSRAQAPGNAATNSTADPVENPSDAAAPAAPVDIVHEGGDAQGHNDDEINAAAPEATVATSEGPARSGRTNGTVSSTPLAQMFPGIVNPPGRGPRVTHAFREIMYIHNVMHEELGFKSWFPCLLLIDNQGAGYMAETQQNKIENETYPYIIPLHKGENPIKSSGT